MADQSAFVFRDAVVADQSQLHELFPELAAFDLPPRRVPGHLWQDDERLMIEHLEGKHVHCLARVAARSDDTVAGFTLTSLRSELLSHEPSAHLEAIVVAPDARGAGLGSRLLDDAEQQARKRGARSMTLHVFGRNERARRVYRASGYDEELIRCIKWLD